jgi:FKBP-type peptidyl-prolyl cis-trans isomerase SlyD
MTERVADKKYVELTYQVIDQKTEQVLTEVEFPLGYVHGINAVLSPAVMDELEGHAVGDIIEVPVDCDALYGPRDESLVITDYLEHVPKEYHEVGMSILMENDRGQTKTFIVTRIDDTSITIDGNNPLCGRLALPISLGAIYTTNSSYQPCATRAPLNRAPAST